MNRGLLSTAVVVAVVLFPNVSKKKNPAADDVAAAAAADERHRQPLPRIGDRTDWKMGNCHCHGSC